MKHLKKFNESEEKSLAMKQFVLTTTSESSDHYIYFIENSEMPNKEELEKFLIENGNDVEDGYSYEHVDMCKEIKDFKRL